APHGTRRTAAGHTGLRDGPAPTVACAAASARVEHRGGPGPVGRGDQFRAPSPRRARGVGRDWRGHADGRSHDADLSRKARLAGDGGHHCRIEHRRVRVHEGQV
ncbi:MAG: hypothetical protein AVDCRST_MAG88-3998, partial [uncultured Thermomicrobiales bacterium]